MFVSVSTSKKFRDEGHTAPSILINLGQTVDFHPTLDTSAPALLLRSQLYNLSADLAQERLVHPVEHWGIMGFPIYVASVNDDGSETLSMSSHRFFPWPESFVLKLPASRSTELAGNGMHLAAIAAVMTFAVSILVAVA